MAGAAVTYEDHSRGEKRRAAPTATSTMSKTRIADELSIEQSPRQNASQHISSRTPCLATLGSSCSAALCRSESVAATSSSMNREFVKATDGRIAYTQSPKLICFCCAKLLKNPSQLATTAFTPDEVPLKECGGVRRTLATFCDRGSGQISVHLARDAQSARTLSRGRVEATR